MKPNHKCTQIAAESLMQAIAKCGWCDNDLSKRKNSWSKCVQVCDVTAVV